MNSTEAEEIIGLEEARNRWRKAVISSSIGMFGIIASVFGGLSLIQSSASQAASERARALSQAEAAKIEYAETQGKNELLKKENAALIEKNIDLKSQNSVLSVSVRTDNLKASKSPNAEFICYVKYHDDPDSEKLASKALSLLLESKYTAFKYVANYQGPSKKGGMLIQVRYSADKDKVAANSIARLLTEASLPATVSQIREPGGQAKTFRVWVMQ